MRNWVTNFDRYRFLLIFMHVNSSYERAAALARAARLTNALRSPKTAFERLTCIINFSSIKILINNFYGTIDSKNIRRNRIGQNSDPVNLH